MKNFSVIIFILLIGCSQTPEVTFQRLDGKTFSLRSLQGKWVIINYWASWCKPCHEEIPILNKIAARYPLQVSILGVNFDRVEIKQLQELVKQMHIKYVVVQNDPAQQLGIDTIPGLPATFIINPHGMLIKRLLGPQTEKTLLRIIQLEN